MAKPAKTGRQDTRKRTYGFVQTASLLSRRIAQVSEKRGFAESRLLTNWAEIVGRDIAEVVRPVKVTYGREGFGATLIVLCKGARAPEVEMQLPVIRERVNACYGYNAISRVRVTQTASTGFAEPKVPFDHKPARPRQLDPVEKARLDTQLTDVADSDLQRALAALGDNVLGRAARQKDH